MRGESTQLQNPATRFFEWGARQGGISWYDKKKKERIAVELPFRFLVLEQVSTIGGGKIVGTGKNKQFIRYWSNALPKFDINRATFFVRSEEGPVGQGIYNECKTIPGAKLVAGLYIAYHDDDGRLTIGHLKLEGSARNTWFDFTKGRNVETGVITLTRGTEETDQNDNVYYLPRFQQSDAVTPETESAALALAGELGTYLTAHYQQNRNGGNGHAENGNGNGHAENGTFAFSGPDNDSYRQSQEADDMPGWDARPRHSEPPAMTGPQEGDQDDEAAERAAIEAADIPF